MNEATLTTRDGLRVRARIDETDDGETCDLEVTIFDGEGGVVESQDFG